ncbi:DddA-like double-stranded DNA deaminase toxin [Micromonospora echinofusca]|uniref:DddA-like double-stranded DNA deaminase toxin n=1 Tax=Micromonospora echinofusca TaxID=47858 RepID=UPI0033C207AC
MPRRQAKDPTSGVALIGGERIPMRSGRDPAAADDLKPAYKLIATTTDHLEAKLAARMRRDHINRAAVVTNNPPATTPPTAARRSSPGCCRPARSWPSTYATMTVRYAIGVPTPETERRSHEGDLDLRPRRPARQSRGRTDRPRRPGGTAPRNPAGRRARRADHLQRRQRP